MLFPDVCMTLLQKVESQARSENVPPKPSRHKVTFRNSFSKTAIKISSSFHNHHSAFIINQLSVKGEFSETTIIISRKDY
jgi:hypothetical protein